MTLKSVTARAKNIFLLRENLQVRLPRVVLGGLDHVLCGLVRQPRDLLAHGGVLPLEGLGGVSNRWRVVGVPGYCR